MKNPPILLLGLATLLVAVGTACFDNSDPLKRASAVANVTGTWSGSTTLDQPVRMDLSQSVLTVTGSATIGSLSGSLTGTIDGNRLDATVQSQPPRRIFATVTDTNEEEQSMSGTIRDISGGILSNFDARLK